MVMNLTPEVKVVCLKDKVLVSGPGFVRTIRQGQVIDQTGKVSNIDLVALSKSSNLISGFATSLPFAIRDYRQGTV
jgi:hypothetical protein